MDTDWHGSSGGDSIDVQSRARLSSSRSASTRRGDDNDGTMDKVQLCTESDSCTSSSAAATTAPPSQLATPTTDISLPPLREKEGSAQISSRGQQGYQHRRRQRQQRQQYQFGLPPAPALPTAAFGELPGINPFGIAYGAGGTAAARNDRRPDHCSQQNQQEQHQKKQQQQQKEGQAQQETIFGIRSTPAIQQHQINALRGHFHTEPSFPHADTTATSRTINENNNNYDDLFIVERNCNSDGTFLVHQQESSSFNAINQLPQTAGTINMPDTLVDRNFLYPFDRFDTGPSAAPTTSKSTEAEEFEGSTLQLQQKDQIEYPGNHSDRSFGQQAAFLEMSSMATSTSDFDPIRPPSQISQLPPSDMTTANTSYQGSPSTKSNKSDLELNLELQMMILQQQQQQLILLQRQRQLRQQQQQRQEHEVHITVNPQQHLSDGSGSAIYSQKSQQLQQTQQQQTQQFSVQPQMPFLPWAPMIDRSVLQATSRHIMGPGWTNLAGASALTNYSYNLERGSSQSGDRDSQNLTASQHRNASDNYTMVSYFHDSNLQQFVQSTATNYQAKQSSDKRQDRAHGSHGNSHPKRGRYALPAVASELSMGRVESLGRLDDPTRQLLVQRASTMGTKSPVGQKGVSCSTFQPHKSKTADRFETNDIRTVPGIESILDRPETQSKAERMSKSTTASISIKGKVLKPLSAYNYFFTDERERLVNETDGEDQCGARYSEERKLWLLSHHWSKDRTKRRRHRKTHGKIEFTELSRLIGQRWRDLPESEKDFYRSVAKADMERYKKDSGS